MAKETTKAQPQKQVPQQSKSVFPLDKINLVLIAICIVLIAVGFALMGGSANEGSTFNYDIFSTRRTVVGPTIALLGFVLMIVAIMYKKKGINKPNDASSQHEA